MKSVKKIANEILKIANPEDKIDLTEEEIVKIRQIKKKYLEMEKKWYDSCIEKFKEKHEEVSKASKDIFDKFFEVPTEKNMMVVMHSIFSSDNEIKTDNFKLRYGDDISVESQSDNLSNLKDDFTAIVFNRDD